MVQTRFDDQTNVVAGYPRTYQYTYTNYTIDGAAQNEPDLSLNTLTNGQRIVGLLTTPKYDYLTNAPLPVPAGFDSNYVFAYVRALNGPAVEKPPQQNAAVKDLSFRYRLLTEVVPYRNWARDWVDYPNAQNIGLSTNEDALPSQAKATRPGKSQEWLTATSAP